MSHGKYAGYAESYPDFPKKGVLFWDFTPLLKDPDAFRQAISDIMTHFSGKEITKIAAIEAKGFVIGGALAQAFNKPLVLIRKPGLIPGAVSRKSFVKEYGTGEYEIGSKSISAGDKVLLVYDILAAPGATEAAISLAEEAGAKVVGCAYVIELEYLRARSALKDYDIFSLIKIKDKKQ